MRRPRALDNELYGHRRHAPLAAGGVRERMGRNARAIQEIKARLNLVDIARRYVDRRGISEEVAKLFGLGWSRRDWQSLAEVLRRAGFSDSMGVEAALLGKSERGRAYDRFRGRLMFPIRSLSGNVIAFGGRIIANEDEAKYINSSDSQLYKKGEHLYGLQQARRAIATGKPAMLTEGYMDVVTLHQFGYSSAVGVLGTAFTPEQV